MHSAPRPRVATLAPQLLDGHGTVEAVLRPLWNDAHDDDQVIFEWIETGLGELRAWIPH